MIDGVTNEIKRLEYVAWECSVGGNPHNLDIEYMREAAKHLRAYRDLHPEYVPLPPFVPPEN